MSVMLSTSMQSRSTCCRHACNRLQVQHSWLQPPLARPCHQPATQSRTLPPCSLADVIAAASHVRRPRILSAAASAADASAGALPTPHSSSVTPQWRVVVGVAAGCLLLCNLHRSTFAVLLPDLAAALHLRPTHMGLVQSAMLATYLLGQLPAGRAADKQGGLRVLLMGLCLWSAATALSAAAAAATSNASLALVLLLVSRLGMGWFSACIMPCVTSILARWVAPEQRASSVSFVYANFNVGGVVGLSLVPELAHAVGVGGAFLLAGAAGGTWALAGAAACRGLLAGASPTPQSSSSSNGSNGGGGGGSSSSSNSSSSSSSSSNNGTVEPAAALMPQPPAASSTADSGNSRNGSADGRHSSNSSSSSTGSAGRGCLSVSASDGAGRNMLVTTRSSQDSDPASSSAAAGSASPATPTSSSSDSGEHDSGTPSTSRRKQQQTPRLLRTLQVLGRQLMGRPLSAEDWRQVVVLCSAHAVMGWGFFLLQNWLPLYLASLGPQALVETGRLSSMPWLAAALVGMLMGSVADGLIQWGLPILSVRRLMQCISFWGCALAVLPLALHPQPGLGLATACLTANLAAYSVSYGGFHAYLQDVAGKRAGVLQGLTNSCSILTGIAGTITTGWLLEATGSYSGIFTLLIVIYAAAGVAWATCISSHKLA